MQDIQTRTEVARLWAEHHEHNAKANEALAKAYELEGNAALSASYRELVGRSKLHAEDHRAHVRELEAVVKVAA